MTFKHIQVSLILYKKPFPNMTYSICYSLSVRLVYFDWGQFHNPNSLFTLLLSVFFHILHKKITLAKITNEYHVNNSKKLFKIHITWYCWSLHLQQSISSLCFHDANSFTPIFCDTLTPSVSWSSFKQLWNEVLQGMVQGSASLSLLTNSLNNGAHGHDVITTSILIIHKGIFSALASPLGFKTIGLMSICCFCFSLSK